MFLINFATIGGAGITGATNGGALIFTNGYSSGDGSQYAGRHGAISSSGAGVGWSGVAEVFNELGSTIFGYTQGVGINDTKYPGHSAVVNLGSIGAGAYGEGVLLQAGGYVLNGYGTYGAANSAFMIRGGNVGVSIYGAAGTVHNYGSIIGGGEGVFLQDGGIVTNGARGNPSIAAITAYSYSDISIGAGVESRGAACAVTNYGGISGDRSGIVFYAGGVVTNGSSSEPIATIQGGSGVGVSIAGGVGSVSNFGTIAGGGGGIGVDLAAGGQVTNAGDARISGATGVEISGAAGTVSNGYIIAGGGGSADVGVNLTDGGVVTNAAGAVIYGYGGVYISGGAGTVTNNGRIAGSFGYGLTLGAGGLLNNGPASPGAYIGGQGSGLLVTGAAGTVKNSGTITGSGQGGWGVLLESAGSVLTNGAKGDAKALIEGYNGLLIGAGAKVTNFGVISGFGSNGHQLGAVSLQAATSELIIETGSSIQGAVSGTGEIDIVAGPAALGDLESSGKIIGAGTLSLNGSATFNTGSAIEALVVQSATGAVATVGGSVVDLKTWTQGGGTVSVSTGDRITFEGVGSSFAGTLAGAGTVVFGAGSTTLAAGLKVAVGHLTLQGANTTLALNQSLAYAGVWIQTGGTLSVAAGKLLTFTGLGDHFGGTLAGAGTVEFAGGSDTLETGLKLSAAKVVIAGAATQAVSTGAVTISGAITNGGTLVAAKGVLTVTGAVSGAGKVLIEGGTADFTSTFTEAVAFSTAGGTLELAKSQTYTGVITGFAKAPTTALDLLDIAFTAGKTKASYSGSATSGVLTVTDGTHTAKIKLSGNYTTSTFTVASDGHGGTKVVDPPTGAGTTHAFIAAMAAFGAAPGLTGSSLTFATIPSRPLLAAPA